MFQGETRTVRLSGSDKEFYNRMRVLEVHV